MKEKGKGSPGTAPERAKGVSHRHTSTKNGPAHEEKEKGREKENEGRKGQQRSKLLRDHLSFGTPGYAERWREGVFRSQFFMDLWEIVWRPSLVHFKRVIKGGNTTEFRAKRRLRRGGPPVEFNSREKQEMPHLVGGRRGTQQT